jgi:hypothetical protein
VLRKIGSLALIPLLLSASLSADTNIAVGAKVDRRQVSVGEGFVYTVVISANQTVHISTPRLPDVAGVKVLNRSQSEEVRNVYNAGRFEVQKMKNYHYNLVASQEGVYTIPSSQVEIDGQIHKTRPIRIHVVNPSGGAKKPKRFAPYFNTPKPMARPQAPRRMAPSQSPFDDPFFKDPFFEDADDLFSQLLKRRGIDPKTFNAQPIGSEEDLVIRAEVSATQAYAGEQIVVAWYLYTPHHVRSIDTLKYPELKGFWKEDMERVTVLKPTQEVINGVVYEKSLLSRAALFPLKAGEALVDSQRTKCTLLRKQQGFLGYGAPVTVTTESREIRIRVLPLPEGKPTTFTGAVGQFKVQAKIAEKVVKSGEPFKYTIKIAGRGNVRNIDLPSLNLADGVDIYDTETRSHFSEKGTGFKEFEVFLISSKVGKVTLAPFEFSYFDPDKKIYEVVRTEPLDILVEKGKAPSPQAHQEKSLVKPIVEEPKLPDLEMGWESKTRIGPKKRFWAWVIIYLAIALLLIWRAALAFDWGNREADLSYQLSQRINGVKNRIRAEDWRAVGAETLNALYFVLGEISGAESQETSFEKLLESTPLSVRQEFDEEFFSLVKTFEALSFAPDSMIEDLKRKRELEKKASKIGARLERAIKSYKRIIN